MTYTASEPTKSGRRGRPKGTSKVPADTLPEVWIQVFIARVTGRTRTGKTPSVRRVCHDIAERGGIISAVGGNRDALAAANAERDTAWQRFEFETDGYGPVAAGTIYVNHTITYASTLQARYSDAKRLASNPRVRLFWMDLARQRLGLPPKHRGSPSIGRGQVERS